MAASFSVVEVLVVRWGVVRFCCVGGGLLLGSVVLRRFFQFIEECVYGLEALADRSVKLGGIGGNQVGEFLHCLVINEVVMVGEDVSGVEVHEVGVFHPADAVFVAATCVVSEVIHGGVFDGSLEGEAEAAVL